MMTPKKEKGFTKDDKKRIMSKESKEHGEIRKGSLAHIVQKRVDKGKTE